jgi:serine/threonine protein kinase
MARHQLLSDMYTFLTSSVASCYHLQMTTSIAVEDVRREVKILKALAGNKNLVQFYDAYEDNENVYIVME